MNKFKIGDKVKLVCDSIIGSELYDYNLDNLKIGGEYVISKVRDNNVRIEGYDYWLHSSVFKPIRD
jgi:hypothetical protein